MTRPVLTREHVQLVHALRDTPPWQWQHREPWIDRFSDRGTGYLAGFETEAAAVQYGRRLGWCD